MEHAKARTALNRRRRELDEEDRIGAAARAPVTLDQESVGRLSRIDAMQVQAMALAAERRRAAERDRIAAALRLIDDGEWGFCQKCGEPIAEARLANDPSVSRCIGCAEQG